MSAGHLRCGRQRLHHIVYFHSARLGVLRRVYSSWCLRHNSWRCTTNAWPLERRLPQFLHFKMLSLAVFSPLLLRHLENAARFAKTLDECDWSRILILTRDWPIRPSTLLRWLSLIFFSQTTKLPTFSCSKTSKNCIKLSANAHGHVFYHQKAFHVEKLSNTRTCAY